MTIVRLSRRARQRRRRARKPGTASRREATPMRATTAAAGDQPTAVIERANEPEVPKLAADSTARPRPRLDRETAGRSPAGPAAGPAGPAEVRTVALVVV